jgi:DinB family protein
MDVKGLLQFQLNGSFNLMTEALEGMSDEEWLARPFPGGNLLGFTVWHCARTVDWAVNCVLRRAPELVEGAEWGDVRVVGAAFGAGASKEAADGVARMVPRARVLEYLGALRADSLSWLAALPPDDLSGTVDLKASHAGKAEYLAPAVREELDDLEGIPRWQFLARPCVSHIRVHYGEISSQLEAIRSGAPAESQTRPA